jgi:hypothetical protein
MDRRSELDALGIDLAFQGLGIVGEHTKNAHIRARSDFLKWPLRSALSPKTGGLTPSEV